MKTLRDPEHRNEIVARVQRFAPDGPRRWGRLQSSEVLAHLADQLRMALGDVHVERARGPLRFAPMRYLMVHVLPWPKGKAEAPREAFTTAPTEWEADRATLLALIERFGDVAASELQPLNPVFGRMNERDWGVLSYRHLDHHLSQFSG